MKVLNFGSLNLDYVYAVDHMVTPGETLSSGGMQTFCGGKGLNQSIALAKAGAEVFHAGLVGDGGDILLDACRNAGVNSDYISRVEGPCGHTIIQVDRNGQNCILLYGGANRKVTEEYVNQVLANFHSGDILLLQNEINLLDYIIERAYEKKLTIILNPSPYNEALKSCDFNKVTMFLLNEVEGAQVTGQPEPEKILEELRRLYPDAKIILTLGSAGAVYQDAKVQYRQSIFPVKAVDTTAAGDTFTGYFIASILEGMSVPDGLRMAARASSVAVSRAGAAASIPLRREVDEYNI